MRLSTEKSINGRGFTAGMRECDVCKKQEFLNRTRNWKMCISCQKKELNASGKNIPPVYTKKVTLINFCKECKKPYDIKSEYYRYSIYCGSKCQGVLRRGIPPANKIWATKTERYRDTHRKIKEDPKKYFTFLLRVRFNHALNKYLNGQSMRRSTLLEMEKLLGCSAEFFKKHIESQFTEGMSWENRSATGWNIDHIFPLSKVNMLDTTEALKALNWKNTQPLSAVSNRSKGSKVDMTLDEVLNKGFSYGI